MSNIRTANKDNCGKSTTDKKLWEKMSEKEGVTKDGKDWVSLNKNKLPVENGVLIYKVD